MRKLKIILTVLIIIMIITVVVVRIVKERIAAVQDVESVYTEELIETHIVKKGNVETSVRGIGKITSFSIETLSIGADERISEILVSEGQYVNKDQEIMKVTDGNTTRSIKSTMSGKFYAVETEQDIKYCIYNLDNVGVKLSLPERDIASIKVGQEAKISVTALNKEFDGKVEYIASLPQNERYIVRIKINYTEDIKFGYSAISTILTNKKENVISVPYDYIQMTEDGRYYVYKEDVKEELFNINYNGEGEEENIRTYVEVGTITSTDVEVLNGLKENDVIIMFNW